MPADRRRLILIVLVIVMLLCLVGVVAYNMFGRGGGGDDVAQQPAPTAAPVQEAEPSPEPTQAEPTATPQPPEPTATPEPPTATPEPTATEAVESSMAAASTEGDEAEVEAETPPEAGSAEPAAGSDSSTELVNVEMVEVAQVGEILDNGSFEAGFAENGVAKNWQSFNTVGSAVNFSAETAEAMVKDGQSAQRISIDQAFEPDQFGGIQQTVEVVAGESYTLTINGLIRSDFGSVEASNYGFRLQYALGQNGADDWRSIAPEDWVELPWPEQSRSAAAPEFSEYSSQFVAAGDKVTLFVRGWSKWANGALGEYTLDALSIAGPNPGNVEMVAVTRPAGDAGDSMDAMTSPPPAAEGEVVDKGLPVTGMDDGINFVQDGRFWGALLVLLLLLAGAVYRSGWRW